MKLSHQNNYVAVPTSQNDRFLGEPEQTDRQELISIGTATDLIHSKG